MINKAKANSWQNTCSSSPKTRPSEVFSLLRSISGNTHLPNYFRNLQQSSQIAHTPVDPVTQPSLVTPTVPFLSLHVPPKPFRSTKRMVLGRLTYFLELHDILSPVQAGFRPSRSTVDQVLLFSHSQSQIPSTNLSQAHVQSLPLWILRKLLTQFGTLPYSLNSSHKIFLFALSNDTILPLRSPFESPYL